MSSYDAFASTFSRSRENMRWPEIDHILDSPGFCFEWMRILDVGCGNGRLLTALSWKLGRFDYLGIDSSSGMIGEARRLHPEHEFQVCDMLDLESLGARKYDRVILLASFHHLKNEKDRMNTLESFKESLSDDGILAMTNWHLLGPALFTKYESMYRGEGDFDIKIGAHTRYYHGFLEDELRVLFSRSDFTILEHGVSETGKNMLSILRKK